MTRRRRWTAALAAVLTATSIAAVARPTAAAAADDLIHGRSAAAFTLTPDWGLESYAEDLQAGLGTRRSVTAVLDAANRSTAPCNAAQRGALPEHYARTDYPLPADQILTSSESFCWDPGDSKVAYWVPQGITGSSDTDDDGLWGEKRLIAVSWHYDKAVAGTSADKGVRISLVDRVTGRYRHVLLVEPTRTATPNFTAVPIHAGGLAWLGHYLYVADTRYGLRVFDMERILEVDTGEDVIGRQGGAYYAYTYQYVVPQVASYRQATPPPSGTCVPQPDGLCFSSLALDRSTTPDTLVVGEYRDGRSADAAIDGGRVVRYPVVSDTRRLVLASGKAVPLDAVTLPKSNVQGAQTWKGRYLAGRSSLFKHSFMYSGPPGAAMVTNSWAIGGEDLYHEHGAGITAGKLWSVTEHAYAEGELIDRRAVFAVPLADVG
ncbi:hypothetical protein ACFQFC_10190 [Amorphoplanes digitatis]|uniref:Secreted protein n=1 Tax=Actinoplanes digitatis TaxID=1868 RepID=A0A7W7I1C9_9ACTN|nr:hypothetical protein [Actinoplanes digitatis]MBB4764567.1 hypothetical protein [Actinoplanes digitatis]GID91482.1 hypothetical protein Adi01nite_08940 [Actinoplanes digitatis]